MSTRKSKKKNRGSPILGDNRKARHLYTVEDTLECGLVLVGTEVKSLKQAHFSFTDAYAEVENGELWLRNFQVMPYREGSQFNHDPQRPRRLLAHRREIARLERQVNQKGMTLIPLKIYLSHGYVKVELGLCKGKRMYDKRHSIKTRDVDRDMDREVKHRQR